MKKALTFAVAALIAATAFGQTPSEPDPVRLRLDLIDYVETAFANGDVATLNNLVTLAELVEQTEQRLADAHHQDLNELLRPEVLRLADLPEHLQRYLQQLAGAQVSIDPAPNGLVGVSAPLFDAGAFGGCFIGQTLNELTCHSDLAYCMSGTGVGGNPDSPSREWELKAAEYQCQLEFEFCMNDVSQFWNLCKIIAVLLPG